MPGRFFLRDLMWKALFFFYLIFLFGIICILLMLFVLLLFRTRGWHDV